MSPQGMYERKSHPISAPASRVYSEGVARANGMTIQLYDQFTRMVHACNGRMERIEKAEWLAERLVDHLRELRMTVGRLERMERNDHD